MGAVTIATNMRLLMIPNCKPTSYNRLIISSFGRKPSQVWCMGSTAAAHVTVLDQPSSHVQHNPPRRSGNYGPSFWDFNYFQSLNSEYTDERYLRRVSELKVEVKKMLVQEKEMWTVEELELVDDLQKLGISYHFEDEINQMLGCLYEQKYGGGKNNSDSEGKERDLYSTALEFRLLRQHGFSVPQEVFDCFKNEKGEFNPSLAHDTNGLLQLYEASFLSTPGEKTLDLAREFATNFLQKNPNDKIDENLSSLVCHALEFPIHWRAQRPNARWFIDAYERRSDVKSVVLQLAKLDFNIVQAMHQEELKHLSSGQMYAQHIYKRQSGTPEDMEAVRSLSTYHDIIRYSGTIARLADDLATSTRRGGRVHKVYDRRDMEKMNEEAFAANSPFSKDFVRMAADVGRIAQYMYQHGDGHGVQGSHIKDRTSNLLFQPIP
ncbi:UNVERIFIED_CONTAM: (-)-alpha-terpineol synthase [Sesamum calycinum]|uniref:(-)-alpha-terpineol synthase n=1 Tax=Sesamum calycinum TaxID=2727403 RepID=A0AAW2PLA9_9LAMI